MKKTCSSCKYYWAEECTALSDKGVVLRVYRPKSENKCCLYRPTNQKKNDAKIVKGRE